MKAVVFKTPYELAVEEVPDPRIQRPFDAIIRITTANICGSDLHPYDGRAALDPGMVLGHENMGIVEEIGSAVNRIKVDDRCRCRSTWRAEPVGTATTATPKSSSNPDSRSTPCAQRISCRRRKLRPGLAPDGHGNRHHEALERRAVL